MSDKKDFTPVEFAKKILEGVHNQLKKHEELLLKSKNTAHEIDPGQEPKNDDAECPPMLAEGMKADSSSEKQGSSELFKKKKKQASEDSEMEDESSDSEESYEEESEESESKENNQFQKSEDDKKNPSFDREKKDKEWTTLQRKMVDRTKPGTIRSNRADQAKYIEEAKKRRAEYRKQGLLKEETKETKGIHFDKPSKSDKSKEEEKGVKRPLEKCGEMKKEEHDKAKKCGDMPEMNGVKKLKKFLQKKK
jgi:hypothetical protein